MTRSISRASSGSGSRSGSRAGSRSGSRSTLPARGAAAAALAAAALAAAALTGACGDNGPMSTDAAPRDAAADAVSFPPAPALGAQLDRAGRPLVATALIALFETGAMAETKRDAYAAAADPATWADTMVGNRRIDQEIASNLAVFDVLDQGHAMVPQPNGCRNQLLYNGNVSGGGVPSATSYDLLADLFADDMLYVDTSQSACPQYLTLELEATTGGTSIHVGCGGRTPGHDVVDVMYSLLAAGLGGFTPQSFTPLFRDNVDGHGDLTATFPYFGPPR